MQTVTTDHIPVLIQDLDDKGIKGATDGVIIKWSFVVSTLNARLLPWMIMNTLKTEITLPIYLAMSNSSRAVTKVLMSCLGVTNPHLRRNIAINFTIHSGVTEKYINSSIGYTKLAN